MHDLAGFFFKNEKKNNPEFENRPNGIQNKRSQTPRRKSRLTSNFHTNGQFKPAPKMNKTTEFMILIHVFNPKICSYEFDSVSGSVCRFAVVAVAVAVFVIFRSHCRSIGLI